MNKYLDSYKEKVISAKELVARMQPGWNIWIDIALAQPRTIMEAMDELAANKLIGGIKVHNMLEVYPAPWYREDLAAQISGISWFSGVSARNAVNRGNADVMPAYYRDIPDLIR